MMTAIFVCVPVLILYFLFGGVTLRNIEDRLGLGRTLIKFPAKVKVNPNQNQQNQNHQHRNRDQQRQNHNHNNR